MRGFGALTHDNRRIITMEWIVEGVTLISTAVYVAVASLDSDRRLGLMSVFHLASGEEAGIIA